MLVILFISVFEYTYFCFNLDFLSIYHIHSVGHIFIYIIRSLHHSGYFTSVMKPALSKLSTFVWMGRPIYNLTCLGSDGVAALAAILSTAGPDSSLWSSSLRYLLRCPALISFSTKNFRLQHLLVSCP